MDNLLLHQGNTTATDGSMDPRSAGDDPMSSGDSSLGLTLQLSSEIATALRKPPAASSLPSSNKLSVLSPLKPKKTGRSEAFPATAALEKMVPFVAKEGKVTTAEVPLLQDEDDWEEMLAMPINSVNDEPNAESMLNDETEDGHHEEHQLEQQPPGAYNNNDDEDDLSDSPPPSLPVIVMDMERLVGYRPSTAEEAQQLKQLIQDSLWWGDKQQQQLQGNPQDEQQAGNDNHNNNINNGDDDNIELVLEAAQYFDRRITELLDMGVARHADTGINPGSGPEEQATSPDRLSTNHSSRSNNNMSFAVVHYPEFVTIDNGATAATVIPTARAWKRLLQPHRIPVVDRILTRLRDCHRSLVWKYAMHTELCHLAHVEELDHKRRVQSRELEFWKTLRRKEQLEKLYAVRETMDQRFSMALERVTELEEERDAVVAKELRRRHYDETIGGGGGLAAFDFESTVLAFPLAGSNAMMGLYNDDDDDDDDAFASNPHGRSILGSDDNNDHYADYEDNGHESHRDSGYDTGEEESDHHNLASAAAAVLGMSTDTAAQVMKDLPPPRSTKARRDAAAKKRRRRLEEAAEEAKHKAKLEAATAQETLMREALTTNELKVAQALATSLEMRLANVDALLESLQEEEWADQEAEEEVVTESDKTVDWREDSDFDAEEFSLLDQVLAMIFGSLLPALSLSALTGPNKSTAAEDHIKEIQAEHQSIVEEWKSYFGRLPPSVGRDNPPPAAARGAHRQTELRANLGIVDNDDEDWDNAIGSEDDDDVQGDDDDNDGAAVAQRHSPARDAQAAAFVSAAAAAPPARAVAQPSPKAGLRPGGRIQP